MKTGNTRAAPRSRHGDDHASMEPGHEDREYPAAGTGVSQPARPQWSPVMKTGNTHFSVASTPRTLRPQWSPVMKTGNT